VETPAPSVLSSNIRASHTMPDSIWDTTPELRVDAEAARERNRAEQANKASGADWPEPDMQVLRLHRRPPPVIPLNIFGPFWSTWMCAAAEAAACPVDYVMVPMLATASALIGHARWAEATPGWAEPPHLWVCAVGDPGAGKSPGADCLMRDVLPEIEAKMLADFPERLREWQASTEFAKAAEEKWRSEVRDAHKKNSTPPLPPKLTANPEPQAPRLRQNDVTIERVATLLATAAPKGLLVVRDELAGWVDSMNAYTTSGRLFWIEAYGGRPYRVERQKHPDPIIIPRLAVAVCGSTQPDRLVLMMRAADDGLLSRILWCWPEPVQFRLGRKAPGAQEAIAALDKLRELELQAGHPPKPVMVRLADEARDRIEHFGREMQDRQSTAGGLLCSAIGKARGHALRLALTLEEMWWRGKDGIDPPPATISATAFDAAALLMRDYFTPMAERVYGDAAATPRDRNAAALARWIIKNRPTEVYIRHLQRSVRLPGMQTADAIRDAANVLVEADWLRPPP